jgi:hypothetical protein
MERGRRLEPQVLTEVEKVLGETLKSVGLVLRGNCPFLGASPDAISDSFVVEVKCPTNQKSMKNYTTNGAPTSKCMGQIQLQMYMTDKKEGVFCVADPEFEANKKVSVMKVKYDQTFIENLIENANSFWQSSIFPRLMSHKVY